MSKAKLLIRGPALSASGYGEHCRFLIRSIRHDDRYELFIDNINWGTIGHEHQSSEDIDFIHETCLKTKRYLAAGNPTFDATIQVTIPNEFKRYANINIGVTAGIETDRVSPKWIEACEQMDKIITISEHSKNGLVNTVVEALDQQTGEKFDFRLTKPVSIVPYPVRMPEKIEGIDLNLSTSFNFLLMALMGERKNIPNTIKWFVEEFHDEEDVGLIVKTSMKSGSTIDKLYTNSSLKSLLKSYPDRKCKVYLLHGRLTESEKHSLYVDERVKALVSLAHGEGFGLPIFEAAYSGLPVVVPNWSGHVDFLTHEVEDKKGKKKQKGMFSKVEYITAPVQRTSVWEGVIEKDARWCFPKENSYKMKIREVYKNYELKKSIANKLKEKILIKYEQEKINKLFYNEVMEVLEPILSLEEETNKEIEDMFKSLTVG